MSNFMLRIFKLQIVQLQQLLRLFDGVHVSEKLQVPVHGKHSIKFKRRRGTADEGEVGAGRARC